MLVFDQDIILINAQIRVSSEISNGPLILNLDCDMYANDADTVREAVCFFMDERKGHEISFVQFPQNFENITKNDIYGCSCSVVNKVGRNFTNILARN